MRVIVPVKSFRFAKSRLNRAFGSAMRVELARTLARNILVELSHSRMAAHVTVVTSEPEMADHCSEFGMDYLWDAGEGGLNGALAAAENWLGCRAQPTAVVCADLPFFRAEEFDRIAQDHLSYRQPVITLVSDQAGQGTNLRLVTAKGGLPYLYGINSAQAHRVAAAAHGLHVNLLSSPNFALDLDTPDQAQKVVSLATFPTGGARQICALLSNGLSKEPQPWLN